MDAPQAPPTVEAPRPASRTRRSVRDCLLICLGIKGLLFFLGVAVAEVRLDKPFREMGAAAGLWNRWDSKHYFDIAENGYGSQGKTTTLVFPPLLPFLIRSASWITGSLLSGGAVVATLLSFLPPLLLFQLARCDLGEEDAFRAMLVLLLFPTSFFIHIAYTEGLFLSLVLGAFLAARRGSWKTVAVLGLLAGLTRINAFILAPALLAEAWGGSSKGRPTRVLATLTVGLGLAVYLAINYVAAGNPLAFLGVQTHAFYRTFAWPWQGGLSAWNLALAGGSNSMMNGVFQGICIPLLALACVISAARQRRSYAIWTVANVLVFTSQGFWLSLPRYCLVFFPAFIWLAPRTAHPVFGTLWFTASTLLLSFFAGQFAQGWWVS